MAWAALIPAAMSAVSALSQSGKGQGDQPQQSAAQGANGAWSMGIPQTGGTLAQQAQNGGQNDGKPAEGLGVGPFRFPAQPGTGTDKPLGVMDFINPAGSTNSYLGMLNPDPLSKGLGSIFNGLFK